MGILCHSPSYTFEAGSLPECKVPIVHLGWGLASPSDPPVSVSYHTGLELEEHSDHAHLIMSGPHGWAAISPVPLLRILRQGLDIYSRLVGNLYIA